MKTMIVKCQSVTRKRTHDPLVDLQIDDPPVDSVLTSEDALNLSRHLYAAAKDAELMSEEKKRRLTKNENRTPSRD
jgi:hypothetical protein